MELNKAVGIVIELASQNVLDEFQAEHDEVLSDEREAQVDAVHIVNEFFQQYRANEKNVLSYLTSREAADVLRIRPDYLAKLRYKGTGPSYIQAMDSGHCLYRRDDLISWLESHTVRHEEK